MAYISQKDKKDLAPAIKAVLKKYNVKGTIGIRHHSTLVVNIKEGALDFIGNANIKAKKWADNSGCEFYPIEGSYQVNPYHFDKEEGIFKKFFTELEAAMKGTKWYDNSDMMTDYFETAYYLSINIGKYDKPYILH